VLPSIALFTVAYFPLQAQKGFLVQTMTEKVSRMAFHKTIKTFKSAENNKLKRPEIF